MLKIIGKKDAIESIRKLKDEHSAREQLSLKTGGFKTPVLDQKMEEGMFEHESIEYQDDHPDKTFLARLQDLDRLLEKETDPLRADYLILIWFRDPEADPEAEELISWYEDLFAGRTFPNFQQ